MENDNRLHRKKIKNSAFLRSGFAATLPCLWLIATDSEERILLEELDTIIPDKGNRAYDMKKNYQVYCR